MKNRLGRWVFWCALLVLCGCGGGGSKSATSAQIRLVNSTHAATLTMTATSTASTTATATTVNSGVAEGAAGSYGSLTAGSYTVNVSTADGSLTAATQTLTLTGDIEYTLVAYQRGGVISLLLLTDSITTPASGFASITVANYSSDAGAVDIYATTPGADISNLSPTITNLSSFSTSITQSITAGTYDIVITATNKPTDVRLTMHSVVLASTEIAVLALTSTTSGSLVDGTIIQQGGAIQLQRVTEARVRVVAAFPANGATNSIISGAVGGTALAALTSPSIGVYTLAPAGSTTYGIAVDGVDVTGLPAATFASGGDYTIMLYDSPSSPKVVVYTDNNLLPSTGAKIRFINAAVPNGGLTLIDNYVPLNTGLQFGQASTYSGVSSGTSLLQITSPVTAFPTYSPPAVSLASGGVYTLFVLGTTAAPIETLNKDR